MNNQTINYRNKLNQTGKIILNAFYPPACPVCGKPLPYNEGKRCRVCPECEKGLKKITGARCMKCGKQLSDEIHEYCYDCGKTIHEFTQGAAVYGYTDGIKQSIYRFKYKNRREYASFYAEEIITNCKERMRGWDAEALIPVPLHQTKLKLRGYNQAALIANELGKLSGIPVDHDLIIRSRKTVPMKELNDNERRKNLKNAFHINKNIVKYGKVILIDDIYTTGATIDACARILKDNGVKSVYFICLCIGKGF